LNEATHCLFQKRQEKNTPKLESLSENSGTPHFSPSAKHTTHSVQSKKSTVQKEEQARIEGHPRTRKEAVLLKSTHPSIWGVVTLGHKKGRGGGRLPVGASRTPPVSGRTPAAAGPPGTPAGEGLGVTNALVGRGGLGRQRHDAFGKETEEQKSRDLDAITV